MMSHHAIITSLVALTSIMTVNAEWKCPFAHAMSSGPSIPPLPNTYTVKVEANIRRDGANAATYTTIADEVYDFYGNRASILFRRDGAGYKALYSYETGEVFYIDDGQCVVAPIDGSASVENAFFGVDTKDGRKHIYSPNRAIEYGLKFNETYIGRDKVRSIDVDHWQACGYWAEKQANFTLDWYYTVTNWSSALGASVPQVPVRATVSGQSNLDGDFHTFNHTYEFIDFRTDYGSDAVFETPQGIVCPGRKNTKAIPKLKQAFSYNEEIVVALQQGVLNAKVMYDSTMNLVRFDWRNAAPRAPYYSTNPMTAIHDYTLGISYVRDNLILNCSITQLRNDTFDESKYKVNDNDDAYVLRMRTPDELFMLDDGYTYEGTRYLRDMDTDVYIKKKPYKPLGYEKPFNATFEAYFLSQDWVDVSSGLAIEKQVPLRLIIWSVNPAYKMFYNIFNFDNDNPDFRSFDVSDCYSEDLKRQFLLTFKPTSNYGPNINLRRFASLVHTNIKTLLGVSNLRIQFPKVTQGGDEVYVTSTILDKAPAYALFRSQGDGSRRSKDKRLSTVQSMQECAERCRDEGDFHCNSYDYCPESLKCFLDKRHSGDPVSPNDDFTGCSHYARNVDYQFDPEPSLATAWMLLRNNVYSRYVRLDLPTDDGGVMTFMATSIRETSFKTIEKTMRGSYMTEFQMFKQQVVLMKNDKVIPNLSVDECAKACTTQVDFDCKSFDYCNNVGECLLSHFHPSDDPSVVTTHKNCDLYARLYVLQFQLYPGTSILTQQDYVASGVTNEEDCAKACLQHTTFACRSFDFCRSSKTCLLGKEHVLDVPAKNVKSKPSCNHYSRKFTGDFKVIHTNITSPSTNKMVVVGSFPEDCAKICVQDMGDGCNGFAFCGDDHACLVDSQKIRDLNVGQADVKTEYKMCDFYNRTAYHFAIPQDNVRTKIVPVTAAMNSGHFNNNDMIALGFGVCVGGLLLGMVAMFAIFRLRGAKKPEVFHMENINYNHENS